MAILTIGIAMLPCQLKVGTVVVKAHGGLIKTPVIRSMALGAIYLKILSMGRLCMHKEDNQ
jgi:hypothetical protein